MGREESRRTERYIIGARREPTRNSTLDRHQPLAPLVGVGGREGVGGGALAQLSPYDWRLNVTLINNGNNSNKLQQQKQ